MSFGDYFKGLASTVGDTVSSGAADWVGVKVDNLTEKEKAKARPEAVLPPSGGAPPSGEVKAAGEVSAQIKETANKMMMYGGIGLALLAGYLIVSKAVR